MYVDQSRSLQIRVAKNANCAGGPYLDSTRPPHCFFHLQRSDAGALAIPWRSLGPELSHFGKARISQSTKELTTLKFESSINTYLECVSMHVPLLPKIVSGALKTQVMIACQNQNIFWSLIAFGTANVIFLFVVRESVLAGQFAIIDVVLTAVGAVRWIGRVSVHVQRHFRGN